MPPRPRPRPRPQPAPSNPTRPEASSSNAPLTDSKKETDDEDSLFMRNRGRSLKGINMRAAQAAATAPQASSPTGSDDEEDDDETPKRGLGKNRKQNTQGKPITLPKWTKKGAILKLLGDSDSESENNHPSVYDGTPSKRRRDGTVSTTGTPTGRRGERTRARSRSRSLTPPPDLTLAQRFSAQQAIKNALRSENLLPVAQPVFVVQDDNDGDGDNVGVELDPALQHIAQSLAAKRSGTGDFGSIQVERPDMPHHSSSSGPPEVSVHVKWVPHPEDEVRQARPQQSWTFIVKRHHSLKQILSQISDKAHVLAEDLVLMRDGKRVFTGVSPDGLGAWDQVDLEVCDRQTFEELRTRSFRSPTPAERPSEEIDYDREESAAPSEASADHEGAGNKFKIVLRAKGSKEVTLTVRPTTSCGKIVRAFLAVVAKHGGTVPTSPRKAAQVRLCIDGEKQNAETPIADCDLEDGDMVEVVGM